MQAYLRPITTTDEFRELRQAIDRGIPQLMIYGLAGSQKTVFLSALLEVAPSPFIIVTHSKQQAERTIEDLGSLLPGVPIALFPALEGLAFETLAKSREMAAVRLQVISELLAGRLQGVVAPVEALLSYLPPASALQQLSLKLEVGGQVDRERLLTTMVAQGYERVPMVEASGQFSVRGGIIDIFPLTDDQPLRIELFDDEVDSIRRFDLTTQRSLDKLPRALIFPARELVLTEQAMERGIKAMEKDLEATRARVASFADQEAVKRLEQTVNQIITKVHETGSLEGLERYL
ncbi:MAG: transcription-repair coupling factor, partial [Bacillota bacterium]